MPLRKAAKVLLYCTAGALILMLVLTLGVKLAIDRAPEYKVEIKDWVHRQIGYHIDFAHVTPAFRWYGPELYFDSMELRSKDDLRVLAHARGGRIGVDVWQLLRAGKLFALRVELDEPNLTIARVGPHTFSIASEIMLGSEDSSMGDLALNDLPAGTFAIRHGLITVQNWDAALPVLQLRSADLNVVRTSGRISLRADAQLPAELGGAMKIEAAAHGDGRLASLQWTAYASGRDIEVVGWHEFLPDYLARLDAGTGSFSIRAGGTGSRLAQAELDIAAQRVAAKLTDGPSTEFAEIGGVLALSHAGDRWTLSGRHLHATKDGHRDPDSELDVSWRDNGADLLDLRATANYLRIEALLPLLGLLPQQALRDRLRSLAPTGEWRDMLLSLSRATPADPWRFEAKAKFSGAGFAAVAHTPGLRGLSGEIAGTDSGGHLDLDSQAAAFHWPGQFPQPLELRALKATVYWKNDADALVIATTNFELHTPDVNVRGKAAWRQPGDGSSPILTLADTADMASVAGARLYLPHELLPAAALEWLDRAFLAGKMPRAELIFQGPVRNFPFRDGSGLFLARGKFEGMTLDYQEGWPRIEDMAIQAEFRNEGMSARVFSAKTGDLKLDSASARFVDFSNAELSVRAVVHGDAGDAIKFLRATPIDEMAEHIFSDVEAKGSLQSTVDLFFPFDQFDRRRDLVHLELDDVSLKRTGSTLAATELKGDADIDGAQASRVDLRGRLLGGPLQVTARSPANKPVTRTQMEFRGTVGGSALRSALSLPPTVGIGGQTDWHGTLKLTPEPARERSLHLASNLVGLELKLPDPLAKAAAAAWPSTFDTVWPANGGTQLRFTLGSILRGSATLDPDDAAKLSRINVTFGSGEATNYSDAQVLNAGGAVPKLDLGGWIDLAAAASKGAKSSENFLHEARLQVGQLDYLGLTFVDVGLALIDTGGGAWRIAVDGPNVAGSVSLPSSAGQPWELEFSRLKFISAVEPTDAPSAPAPAASAEQKTTGDPRAVPAINFHAAELVWDDRQFGEVRATIGKVDDGIVLTELTATNTTFAASATGEWRGKDAGVGHVQGKITSTNVADTLKVLGFNAVMEAKSGRMGFEMQWLGAPTGDALEAATGHVQLELDKGQIVDLKPGGAGRVLGLASVAELPRRLALDFSDLTDKGFAFDTIRGDFELRDGSAFTENVLVKGPAAEIGLIGRVGLKKRDYDQIAEVTGSVGSSPLKFAGFAAGPVVGGAVLLFSQVFKQPLKGLARGYYRITGSWDNPTVERIKSADAAAATAEAPK